MTAPDMVSIIAKVIADNSVVIHDHHDYGEMTASTLTPGELARAVLAAISEAGAVEWGVENGHTPIDHVTKAVSREAAEQEAYDRNLIGIPARALSRITGPWTALE